MNNTKSLLHRIFHLLLPVIVIASAVITPSIPVMASDALTLPAPIDGPRPTITLSVNHGHAGQTINVSGQGVAPFPGVRVVWLSDQSTMTAAVVDRQANNGYNAALPVPAELATGSARICAAVTGTLEAEFACANFTVDPPPPGAVQGEMPPGFVSAAGSMATLAGVTVNLYDRANNVVVSTTVQSNGTFALANVPPGNYDVGATGITPVLVEKGSLVVNSGQTASIKLQKVTGCFAAVVTAVRASPSGKATNEFDFGSYLSFSPYSPLPKVTFDADVQIASGANINSVGFIATMADGSDLPFAVTDAPLPGTHTYRATKNVGDWDPGLITLHVEPIGHLAQNGESCQPREATRRIKVIEHPFQPTALQHNNDRRVQDMQWDGSQYAFDLKIPDAYDGYDNGFFGLVSSYPEEAPSFPLIGPVNNKFGYAFHLRGTLDLDGNVRVTMSDARAIAQLFSAKRSDKTVLLVPQGGVALTAPAGEMLAASTNFDAASLRNLALPIAPITLYEYKNEVPIYDGLLTSFGEGVNHVSIKVSIKIGAEGKAVLEATLRPLAPALDANVRVVAKPYAHLDVTASGFYGVIGSTFSFKFTGALGLLLALNSNDSRMLYVEEPCLALNSSLTIWVNLLYFFHFQAYSRTLADYRQPMGCSVGDLQAAALNDDPPPSPRILAAPALAVDATGRAIATYIEDVTPAAAVPTQKVMARFWNAQSKQWGESAPISDGSHIVDAPTATFFGTNGSALVAWGEKIMTPAEEQAAGMDIAANLRKMEIVYAIWNGSTWSSPQRLTNDNLPDGRPALAGDDSGATMAWVHDLDGNIATRTDLYIAVSSWDGSVWSQPVVINNSSAQNAMNNQVRVARNNGKIALVWTSDKDGEITTNGDRRLIIAEPNGQNWQQNQPVTLPPGAENPTIAINSAGAIYVGLVARGKDGDNKDTGLGDQAVVWIANRLSNVWQAYKVTDAQGNVVRGEGPQLSIGSNDEVLLAVRRFGETGTHAELGQLVLMQIGVDGKASVPIYLTDEARQHWQPALAINPTTGEALLLNVGRSAGATVTAAASLAPASTNALMALQSATLVSGEDTVESTLIKPDADPALDPLLTLSQLHAISGTNVVVSTTVRNVGRAAASGLTVTLYKGEAGSGSMIASIPLPKTLGFNDQKVLSFTVKAASGEQPIYAEVSGGASNASANNDRATAALGQLPAPSTLMVNPNATLANSLLLAWQPPASVGVAGYRILRRPSVGGDYELVGETTALIFSDRLLQAEQSYTYAVQAYDAAGVRSGFSNEASGTVAAPVPNSVYLPLVSR